MLIITPSRSGSLRADKMSSLLRQRIGHPSWKGLEEEKRSKDKNKRYGKEEGSRSDTQVLGFLIIFIVLTGITMYRNYHLPEPNLETVGNHFSSANARKHLNAITNLGIRHTGSVKNEIETRDVILKAVDDIKAAASNDVEIEVSVQQPSGHFFLDFLGGMTHLYENLTNVVVRYSRRDLPVKHALMINCHFDSAIGSPAASDDASSCAILLETLRCLSSTPSPSLLPYAVIFLFNGAEEMILPAAHGFITQHSWASEIRAFLNLESAGAGGKEIVFQTGPKNPWLPKVYSQAVPYPFASVFAQEIFQAGVVPSDTDFRIFRDFGNIPGIDMAYYVNGYVYHTEYDIPELIPDGSIQRAGENILALVKEIATSVYLEDPGDEKHGKVTYFDILGLTVVVYPERIGVILNWATILLTIFGFWIGGKRKRGEAHNKYGLIFKTVAVLLFSEIAAVLAALLSALLTTTADQTLSYYAKPYLVIPLFYIPAVLAMGSVHYWWREKNSHLSGPQLNHISFLSTHLLWLPVLTITTYTRLCSSFIALLWIAFPMIFWTFLWHELINPNMRKSITSLLISLLCYMMALCPLPLTIMLAITVTDLFVPLMGRSGSEVPPDITISIITSFLLCLLGIYTIPSLIHYSTKRLIKVSSLVLTSIWLIVISLVLMGCIFPYSALNPIAPKRLFIQHSQVTFHNSNPRSHSGVYIHVADGRLLKPIADEVPFIKENAKEVDCNGIYCGIPFYLPVIHMVKKNWIIPFPPPLVKSGQLTLSQVEKTSENTRNYTFIGNFPHRTRLQIEPISGMNLKSWSLDYYIPHTTPYGDGLGCYFILYTRGTGNGLTKFWIEVEGDSNISPSLEIAVVALYIDPPLSMTPQLQEVMNMLPKWVTTISWTSMMDVWQF